MSFMAEIDEVRIRCKRRRTGRTARDAIMTWALQALDSERNFATRCAAVLSRPHSAGDETAGRLIGRALYAGGWDPGAGGVDWIERAYGGGSEAEQLMSELAQDLALAQARRAAGEAVDAPRETTERDERPRPRTSPTRIQVVLPPSSHARVMEIVERTGAGVSTVAAELIAIGLDDLQRVAQAGARVRPCAG